MTISVLVQIATVTFSGEQKNFKLQMQLYMMLKEYFYHTAADHFPSQP